MPQKGCKFMNLPNITLFFFSSVTDHLIFIIHTYITTHMRPRTSEAQCVIFTIEIRNNGTF